MSGAHGDSESDASHGLGWVTVEKPMDEVEEPGWVTVEKPMHEESNERCPAIGGRLDSPQRLLKLISVACYCCPFSRQSRGAAKDGIKKLLLSGQASLEHVSWLSRVKHHADSIGDGGTADLAVSLDTVVRPLGHVTTDDVTAAALRAAGDVVAEATVDLGIDGVPFLPRQDFEKLIFELCPCPPSLLPYAAL